jgi:hypothetical protein
MPLIFTLKHHSVGTVSKHHTTGTVPNHNTTGAVPKHHTAGTVPKSNGKIVKRCQLDTPNTNTCKFSYLMIYIFVLGRCP